MSPLGLPAPRSGDDDLHAPHRPSPIHLEAQALHLHLGKSAGSEITIWHEGQSIIPQ